MYLGVFAVVAVAVRARHAAAVSDGLALGIVGRRRRRAREPLLVGRHRPGRAALVLPGPDAAPLSGELLERARDPGRHGAAAAAARRGRAAARRSCARWRWRPCPRSRRRSTSPPRAAGAAVAVRGRARVLRAHLTPHGRPGRDRDRGRRRGRRGRGAARARRPRERAALGAGRRGSGRERRAADRAAGRRLRRRSTGPGAGSPTGTCGCRAPRRRRSSAGLAVVALAGVAAFDPAGKFEDFKRPPAETKYTEGDFTRSHLLSSTSTGRWQLWAAAGDQWETKPGVRPGRRLLPVVVDRARRLPAVRPRRPQPVAGDARRAGRGRLRADRARVRRGLRGRRCGGCAGPGRRSRWWPRCWRAGGVRAGSRDRLDVGADDRRPRGRRGARDAGRVRDAAAGCGAGAARRVVRRRPAASCACARCGPPRSRSRVAAIMCVTVPMLGAGAAGAEPGERPSAVTSAAALDVRRGRALAGAVGLFAVSAARAGRGAGGPPAAARTGTSRTRSSATAGTGAPGW